MKKITENLIGIIIASCLLILGGVIFEKFGIIISHWNPFILKMFEFREILASFRAFSGFFGLKRAAIMGFSGILGSKHRIKFLARISTLAKISGQSWSNLDFCGFWTGRNFCKKSLSYGGNFYEKQFVKYIFKNFFRLFKIYSGAYVVYNFP